MFELASVGLMMTAIYSDYPAFLGGDRTVEAFTDRGPVVELIVRCPVGTGIMSYSKLEGLYCSSKHRCSTQMRRALEDTCR